MRRQITKQPSGPTVIARPMPAIKARVKKSSNTAGFLLVIAVQAAVVAAAATRVMGMHVLAFSMVMSIIGVAMFRHAAISVQHAAVGQMGVVVVMAVERERLGGAVAEEFS